MAVAGPAGGGPMIVRVDLQSKLAPYAQIKQAVLQAVVAGDLAPGDRLPPIRQLAGDLGLAANTVARAYRELDAEGFVASSGRRGTVVAQQRPVDVSAQDEQSIVEVVRAARRRGLEPPAILDVVTRTLAAG